MIIDLKKVVFHYPDFLGSREPSPPALNGIDLTLSKGEVVAVVGASGSGKTTLVQMLNGLLEPQAGRIDLDGQPVQYDGDFVLNWRRRIGLVFQFPEFQFFENSVFSEIAFALGNLGFGPQEIAQRIEQVAGEIGIAHLELKEISPFQLSEGEKRRVAIASILVMEPELLILDEPTSALDERGVELVRTIISRFSAAHRGVIVVSHDMNFVASVAERIVVMDRGRIIFDGDKHTFFQKEEILKQAHLDLPRILSLAKSLRRQGRPVEYPVFSLDQIRKALEPR